MCYSQEVQLITAVIILVSCLFYYWFYSKRYANSKEKWLKSFLNNVVLGFACIGIHQFCEFLSLVTNNQIIYKIGLIVSISSMYFFLRSLEILINQKLYSKLVWVIILGIAIHTLMVPMDFTSKSFYLQHNSVFFWAVAYLLLFIYWNICALRSYPQLKDQHSKKTLLIYLLATIDVSFILSAIYILLGYFYLSVNVCTDSPSIWCTFFVIQAGLVPILLSRLPRLFNISKNPIKMPVKKIISMLLISLLVLITLILTLPFFKCLTWKFVFP